MPITSKSNIRSRWYRPNEKPLKSEGVPQLNEPKGEILINENDKLIDDLSSATPQLQAKRRKNSKSSKKNKDNNRSKEEIQAKVESQRKVVRKKGILDLKSKERTHKIEIQKQS